MVKFAAEALIRSTQAPPSQQRLPVHDAATPRSRSGAMAVA